MNIQTVIDKIMTDEQFREALMANPADTLKGTSIEAIDRINAANLKLAPDMRSYIC